MVCEKRRLFWPKPLNPLLWINRPPFKHIVRQRRMHSYPPVIFKGDELLVEQRVDMRREQQSVVAAEAFGVGGFAPGFDMAGDQQSGVGDAGNATGLVEQNHACAKNALTYTSPREL
jgi:hypothetical protein